MAELVMKVGAPKICCLRVPLQPYSTNFTVGTIRSVNSSSISLRLNSIPNLKKSNLTIYAVAEKPGAGIKAADEDKLSSTTRIDDAFILRYVPSVDDLPPWGVASDSGRRREMEDVVATIPRYMKVPVDQHRHFYGLTPPTHMTAPFFGVYDGYGGSQVANYCRDHIHSALGKELEAIRGNPLNDTSSKDICEEEWRRALTKSFLKVDDEVGEKAGVGPPKIVGSTALVAIVCPSYIVVANCGDSRAVLNRQMGSIPLTVDHKSTREDEYARIEAACGKVVEGNTGYGDYKVLAKSDEDCLCNNPALSRAIGGRHWKPWVVPYPDVMVIPRREEDRCLILASDGLWDVMTNEEAGNMAHTAMFNWYTRICDKLPVERHDGHDPVAQAAADYLLNCALERGSKGNISVVVVHLSSPPYSRLPN